MTDTKTKRAHLYITGKVQGVSFRYHTQEAAVKFGTTGWVRNLPDGRVEAVIEGKAESVDKLVDWCHHGPSFARVIDVSIQVEPPTGRHDSFQIRY